MQFKEDFINAMVGLLIADGEIKEEEENVLNFTAALLGLTSDDVVRITKEKNESLRAKVDQMEASNASSSSSSGGCFIATATMGDYDHPVVLDLRAFRDKTLKKTLFGKLFIKVYYTFGPYPATIIAKSKKLRSLSLKYLIEPLHKFITKN